MITNNILMIRPIQFGFNIETAINNAFQMRGYDNSSQEKAIIEFNNFVKKLQNYDINVMSIQDTLTPHTPDSIFPNNWISFHSDNTIVLYPMFAKNRRAERKPEVIEQIKKQFVVDRIVDLTKYEDKNKFLEGTGSMVLDRKNRIAFACISPRTDIDVLNDFCYQLNYRPITFTAVDSEGMQIYHTNVMMCVAEKFVIVCLDTIKNEAEKMMIVNTITSTNKEIIEITIEQMNEFAGNMLEITNGKTNYLVMSSRAFRSLNSDQVAAIIKYDIIIDSELDTIEKNGGGSARCMLAEIFNDKK